jgi:hypothetical protein
LTKKKQVSQETLIKTLLQHEQPSIKQGLPVEKKTLLTGAFISMLLLSVVVGTSLINLGRANPNPYYPEIISEEGSPDSETEPPTVSIIAPTNGTSYSSSTLSLTYNASVGYSSTASVRFLLEITFEADWLPKNVTLYEFNADKDPYTTEPTLTELSKTLNLTGIPEGTHSLIVHARERGAYEKYDLSGCPSKLYVTNFFINGSSLVFFTVDLTAPTVSVLSVENKTYYTSDIPLTVATNEVFSKIAYSIDGHENVTIAGNTTLTNLSLGGHNITVYIADEAGNTGTSETVFFTIEKPSPFSPLLIVTASAASLVAIGVALLIYFKKRKH